MRRFDGSFLAVFFDTYLAGPFIPPPALYPLHFVFLEKKFDALRMLLDDFVLACKDIPPIDLQPADFETQLLGILEVVVNLGVIQKNLGGNAADMETRSAQERILFHDDGFQSQFARTDGGDVPPRTAPDNRHIVLYHSCSPFRRGQKQTDAFQGCGILGPDATRPRICWAGCDRRCSQKKAVRSPRANGCNPAKTRF